MNTPAKRLIQTTNVPTQVVTDKNAKFRVNQKFLDVLSVVPNFDKSRTVYTYEEVGSIKETSSFHVFNHFCNDFVIGAIELQN